MNIIDIIRYENDLPVEHWDVIEALPKNSGQGLKFFTDNFKSSSNTNAKTVFENKKVIVNFLNMTYNQNHVEQAFSSYVSNNFISHTIDGNQNKTQYATQLKHLISSQSRYDIKRIIAQNEIVLSHAKVTINAKEYVVMEIFKIQNGKIVEHYKAQQEIPKNYVHGNGIF